MVADSTRVNQILINLLANAIKYNHEGGKVILRSIVEESNLTFHIIDNGIGMSEDQLSFIFTPFYRVKSQTRSEGVGLGLPIVAKLTELMNGTYGVKSQLGIGTNIWVTLPLDNRHCSSTEAEKVNRALTVLYIEDNQMNLEVMEAMLEEVTKVNLIVAINGQQGFESAVEKNPDLILLDLGLPDMEGSDVLRSLKQDKRTAPIPVVIVTANAMTEDKQRVIEMGASAYVEKPIDFQLLKSLMLKFKQDIEGVLDE